MKLSPFKLKKNKQLAKQAVLYYKQGLSLREVGRMVGRSYGWVHLVIKDKIYGEKISPLSKNYFGGLREKVINRDKNKCINCGMKNNVQVHHIDKNKLNNTLNNLACLCAKCHNLAHLNKIVVNVI